MDDLSAAFEWGVALFCAGGFALIVFATLAVLIRQLGGMAARLVPTPAVVRADDRAVASLVERVAGAAFRAPFLYDYQVGGKPYTGSLTTLRVDTASRDEARSALAAHRPGDTITVFYDSAHPSRAVIDSRPPVVPRWVRIGLTAAVVAMVAGVVLVAVG